LYLLKRWSIHFQPAETPAVSDGIVIVGEEEHAPYDRPPLSKAVLSGDREPATLEFRSPDWYREHDIELLQGETAVALDPGIKTVTLASGPTLHYESAV
jgi:3-phenylpropionate/trans-cinnamate dioxygenase ferredoxin reductase component